MSRASLHALLGGAILLVVGSCADPRSMAGGTGTGTDNTATARTASLSIDSSMEVGQGSTSSPVPLLLRLDSSNFRFEDARDDGADLLPSRRDGRPLPFVLRDWDKLRKRASLWVRLDSFRRGGGERLILSWGHPERRMASDPAGTWSGIPDSVRSARATVLVSDFESGTGAIQLPCRCNSFYSGETVQGALIQPLPHVKIDSAITSAGAGRSGKALHVVYSSTGLNYALIGTRLGRGSNRFAGLDSLVLWVRGTGSLRVALENGLDTTSATKAWVWVRPDTTWRRFAIRPSDFSAPTAYARGWEAVEDSVNTLSFFFHDGGEMWIDDIRFHGLTASDIP